MGDEVRRAARHDRIRQSISRARVSIPFPPVGWSSVCLVSDRKVFSGHSRGLGYCVRSRSRRRQLHLEDSVTSTGSCAHGRDLEERPSC